MQSVPDFIEQTRFFCARGLDSWGADEIFEALERGRAHLFYIDNGYVVAKGKGSNLHIWLALANQGVSSNPFLAQKEIESIAKDCGFKTISFGTQRKGWERLAPRLGYQLKNGFYIKEVNSE